MTQISSAWISSQWTRFETWLRSTLWEPKSTPMKIGERVLRGSVSTVLCLGTLVCGYLAMIVMMNLVSITSLMLRGAHLPSLITLEHIVNLTTGPVEIVILMRMLQLDQQNHQLYRTFFQERAQWYAARNKKKPPVDLPGGDMLDVVVEDATE